MTVSRAVNVLAPPHQTKLSARHFTGRLDSVRDRKDRIVLAGIMQTGCHPGSQEHGKATPDWQGLNVSDMFWPDYAEKPLPCAWDSRSPDRHLTSSSAT